MCSNACPSRAHATAGGGSSSSWVGSRASSSPRPVRPVRSVRSVRFTPAPNLLMALLIFACAAFSTRALTADEEFVGPFPSWRQAQRDYAARGDGQADDTA